jgi:hypothetical protein
VLYKILLHITVQRLIKLPPPTNLVSEILVYDGVETMEAEIKSLWFLYFVHHPVFSLITHASSGSNSVNLKTGKHAYSFDMIELF